MKIDEVKELSQLAQEQAEACILVSTHLAMLAKAAAELGKSLEGLLLVSKKIQIILAMELPAENKIEI
jgi:hypothetical protein